MSTAGHPSSKGRVRLAAVLATAGLVALTYWGAAKASKEPPMGAPCRSVDDCLAPFHISPFSRTECRTGYCTRSCGSASECPAGWTCYGTPHLWWCQPPVAPTGAGPGAAP